MLWAAPPASATEGAADTSAVVLPDGTTVDPSTVTEEQWADAVDDLIASDVPRTVTEKATVTEYVFHIAVDSAAVPKGTFDLGIAVPKEGVIVPMIGAGSDGRGPYVLLNNFDQNVVLSGAGAAVTAALCAIPAIGWVSCAVITAAMVVVGVWLSQNGTCPQNLKIYLFQQYDRVRCVNY